MNQTATAPKSDWLTYAVVGLASTLFSYIVVKDHHISSALITVCIGIGGVFLFLKGVSKPEVVTYALVAYLPFSRHLVGDFGGLAFGFNLTNLLMAFIIFVWLTGKYADDEPLWLPTPLNRWIMLFLFMGFISVLRGTYYGSGYFRYAFIEYKRWITPVLMFFLVLNTVKKRDTIKTIVVIVGFVTTLVGLMAIYEYIDIGYVSSLDKARVGGISDQPNMLAAFFNYYMFIPLGFLLMNFNKPHYWALLVPFLICFRGIMVTFSRGGYLGFAAALYAIVFFRSKILFVLLIMATIFVLFNPWMLPAGIRYRMESTFQGNTSRISQIQYEEGSLEVSASQRVEVWKGALNIIKEYPYLGVGYGLFPNYIQYYWSGQKKIDAHNTYLIIAAEMGIPTLLIFLAIVGFCILYTWRLYGTTHDSFTKSFALGFLGGLFGLLMSNMFGSRLDAQEISSYFWILTALIMRLSIIDQKERALQTQNNKGKKTHVYRRKATVKARSTRTA